MFPLLSDIVENSRQVKISDSVSQHLSQLTEKFDEYFPEDTVRDTCGFWTHVLWIPSQMMLLCPNIWNPSFWKFPPTAL